MTPWLALFGSALKSPAMWAADVLAFAVLTFGWHHGARRPVVLEAPPPRRADEMPTSPLPRASHTRR